MDKKKQKKLIVVGAILSMLLQIGICCLIYKEPATEAAKSSLEEESEIVVDVPVLEETNTAADEDLVIEAEVETVNDGNEQQLQETPEKTENEKPEEPPTVTEETDLSNPDTEPEYEETKAEEKTVSSETTPSHGQEQGNKIYIEGFGWVTNHGGGGSGTTANDMYENGNKVGIME